MKLESERRIIMKNGSRTGKRWLPHKAVCSKTWAMPVESLGGVRKPTKKVFFAAIDGQVDVLRPASMPIVIDVDIQARNSPLIDQIKAEIAGGLRFGLLHCHFYLSVLHRGSTA